MQLYDRVETQLESRAIYRVTALEATCTDERLKKIIAAALLSSIKDKVRDKSHSTVSKKPISNIKLEQDYKKNISLQNVQKSVRVDFFPSLKKSPKLSGTPK